MLSEWGGVMNNGAIALVGAVLLLAVASIAVENWLEARRRLRIRRGSQHPRAPRGITKAWVALRWRPGVSRDRARGEMER